MSGKFITLEGIDGSGKTTQVWLLERALQRLGCATASFAEPGRGTMFGARVREIIFDRALDSSETFRMAYTFLFLASQAYSAEAILRPALAKGEIVIADRWSDSALVYHDPPDLCSPVAPPSAWRLEELLKFAMPDSRPDLTFWIDVDPEIAHARVANAGVTAERSTLAALRIFAARYAWLQRGDPDRIFRIDGSQNVESVHLQIMAAVLPRLDLSCSKK